MATAGVAPLDSGPFSPPEGRGPDDPNGGRKKGFARGRRPETMKPPDLRGLHRTYAAG